RRRCEGPGGAVRQPGLGDTALQHRDAMSHIALPLSGVSIVEFEGIGPGPLAGRMLQGMGAEVTLIARPSAIPLMQQLGDGAVASELSQGKKRVALDLKSEAARCQAMRMCDAPTTLI